MIAAIPPLSSFPLIPSTSSIIIKFLSCSSPPNKVLLSNINPAFLFIANLFLWSDAFVSYVLYPFNLAINLTEEVLPIPGSPVIKQALALTFSKVGRCPLWNLVSTFLVFPSKTTLFQSSNHSINLFILVLFPIKSLIFFGWYLVVHNSPWFCSIVLFFLFLFFGSSGISSISNSNSSILLLLFSIDQFGFFVFFLTYSSKEDKSIVSIFFSTACLYFLPWS